jgi:hypothetical protein
MKLQVTINKINDWAEKWRIKINQSKSTHITFTLRNKNYPTVQLGSVDLSQINEVKYLGIRLDRRLTWAKLIKTINQKEKQMHWLTEEDQHYQQKTNYCYTKQ